MHPDDFRLQVDESVTGLAHDQDMERQSQEWMAAALPHKYTYNFTWMGLPIIQYPQDILSLQEIIWRVQPSLIIETGVARGGSLLLSASMLLLCDADDVRMHGRTELSIAEPRRRVVGVDIDIRDYALAGLMQSPVSGYLQLLEGSSVDPLIVAQVHEIAAGHDRTMVLLDSDHTHDHVLQELNAYCDLVSEGSYLIVFDTGIEDFPDEHFADRPWGAGNSPMTAVRTFLREHSDFQIDTRISARNQISSAPGGYLVRSPRSVL